MSEKDRKESRLPKVIIFGDPQRKHADEAVMRFKQFSKGKVELLANCFGEKCDISTLRDADFAMVFGGDGTILGAARNLSNTQTPVIGVNVGHLGYLAEFSIEELEHLIDRILVDERLIGNRIMIHCSVRDSSGKEVFCSPAINEIAINAGPPFSSIELRITIDGLELASCSSDGLLFSTPTGSTAYNLSAGGPVIAPDLGAFVLTPVSPHSLSFRPVVLNSKSVVEIYPSKINEGTRVTIDGQVSCQLKGDEVIIARKHENSLRIVTNPLRSNWETLASKLNWAQRPKYKESKGI